MTDKQRAQVLRDFEEYLVEQGHADAAECLSKLADRIDPSKPEIPDGHVWYRWRSTSGDWIPGLELHDGYMCDLHGDTRTIDDLRRDGWEIRPAHTIEPGSVVLSLDEARDARAAISTWYTIYPLVDRKIEQAEQEVRNE